MVSPVKPIRVLLLLLAGLSLQAAQKYALVIGISHYIPGQGVQDLDGPGPDTDAMVRTLISNFGYPPDHVRVLRDAAASRAGILAALDDLIAHVVTGDYVFLYYSGHGTSPQGWHDLPIDADTGAIIPADFRRGDTLQQTASRLVVGRRDLRPRLQRLDAKATVFAVLDTCFSANLVRGLRPAGNVRGAPLSRLVATRGLRAEEDLHKDIEEVLKAAPSEPYPYRNVAWISAALAGQQAVDIDVQALKSNPRATLDGKPHGAFTNAVLTGLSGAADLNHDGIITHAELYDYVLRVSIQWRHQPAWSANDKNLRLPAEAALGGRSTALASAAIQSAFSGRVRIQLEGDAAALRGRLEGTPGIALVSDGAAILVRAEEGGYRLYQQGANPIIERPMDAQETVARIAAEPIIQRLLAITAPNQKARLEIIPYQGGQRSHQGLFFQAQIFDLMFRSSAQVWLLVVDIDTTGEVAVLYPTSETHAAVRANALTSLGTEQVSAPFGVEYLKAFVFDRKPDGYEAWMGQEFPAGDPRLKQLLDYAAQGIADTSLRLITQSKDQGH